MKKKLLFVFLFLSVQKYSVAQTDTAFWFAAPDIVEMNHPLYGYYDRPIYLRITSFSVAANVTISIPANPSFTPINVNIAANSTSTVDLTPWINLIENFEPDNINNKGIYIRSTTDITVYYEVNSITCNCNPELFALKGKNAIGNEFYIPSQLTWAVDTPRHAAARAGFTLVATQNNTTITITPSKPLINRPANVPFTITLNKGQSYACIALYRNGPNMLNGSKMVSDKPVSVTNYEDVLFSDGPCADLAGDQLIPTSIFGTEFAIVRGNLTTRDKVVVTASQNVTNIYLNGNATPTATINAGQSYEYDLIPPAPTLYVQTDKVASIYHYTGTGCEVGAAVIPKLSCTGSSSVSLVRSSNGGNASVMLVTKNGNQGGFLVNGVAGIITASDFSPISGTGGVYVYAKKDITASMPLNVATTFSNSIGKFQLGFFNVTASNGGCMYGFFSDFKKSNVTSSQLEICRYDSAQLNAVGGVVYQWTPVTGLSNPNISNPKASPAVTTDYKVVITDIDGCIDSAFVRVIVNSCTLSCDNWLSTPSDPSYVSVGDLDITGNQITVEANFNRTAPVIPALGFGFLVSKHSGPGNINYALWPNGCAITTVNGDRLITENCPAQINKTYHVAMVYDGVTLKYYRNGFLHSQVAATGNLINNDFLTTIARNPIVGTTTLYPFLGYINEVRIWNVARTQNQIQAYMNASLPAPATQAGLVSYYIFDNLLNKQGNPAWNGTITGSATVNATNTSCNFVADTCPVVQNIGGIINTYTPVLSLNTCDNKLTVEDASTFNTGDTVLLIQMKGAVIDSTNTSSFGTITDYKNAGNYEFNYVKSKSGNIIELRNTITRQYDLPGGKVQLIRVPYYQSPTVTSMLTCLPWDGSKGGVLVLNALDTVVLNANIDVSGKGFRGGNDPISNPGSFFCNESNYYYPVNPDLASEKGEGIAIISAAKSFGRGDLANGGGGGNSHNSGGGGGSNAAPGGFGGYNFEGSPCTNIPFDNRGIGGKALTYSNAANKIFMGGGGGAGHSNNPEAFQANGGNGSGIVIIMADKLKANANKILANGSNATACGNTGSGCHEGMGGGGAGGTTLLKINNYIDPSVVEIKGGNGANMTASGFLKVGPGGGGSGGKTWLTNPSLPASVTVTVSGGQNGVCTAYANDPWGATPGQLGSTLFNLTIPVDIIPFKPNIDSVRIKDSATGCASFDFKGFGYTNTNPINSWQWFFGDGGIANTQNTSHTYASSGTFTVKLIVTDINGCKDSITKNVITTAVSAEFTYSYVPCLQQTTVFLNGTGIGNWDFGDGTFLNGSGSTLHTYMLPGTYIIKYSIITPTCSDSISKIFDATIIPDNIIFTPDTTICSGTTKQLLAQPSGNFCWSPTTYLSNPAISNPITSTPGTITYFYKAETLGNNLISNGDFSAGNTGFTSDYVYQANNTNTTAAYGINSNAQAWNPGASSCTDHTSGTGNMFLANGAATPRLKVWKTTVPVTPNTNYQISFWIQSISPGNVSNIAWIHVYMNNKELPSGITAPVTNCQWVQLKYNWNSGNTATADISLEDFTTSITGNDFALDDIFFGPVYLKRDSVKITVDTASVVTNPNTNICEGLTLQLNTTGGSTYSWSPATGLSNPNIANPVASPVVTTQYIVTGTNVNGCTAKDTVVISVNPAPSITKSNDTTICQTGSAQLLASGGTSYSWSPAATLNNPSIPNPVATPGINTIYYVTVTGANSCSKMDSVKVDVRTASSFSINPPVSVCTNSPVQLNASGGDFYSWTPAGTLNNAAIPNPVATPAATTIYFVQINDTLCHNTANLSTTVTALPLPVITATRSNDIDCSILQSQLSATGANLYNWSPAGSLNNPNSANPVATPTITTQYFVTGTDLSGCINTGTVMVKVSPTSTGGYLMPSAFTPNNDGNNDCYGIKYWGTILQLQFSIYNRWGERIFYSTNPGACWDGTINGVQQDPAVFIYMIKAKTTCQPEVFRKGTFVLIR